MASAYVDSTFIPPLFGIISNSISIKLLPFFLYIFFVLMIEKTYNEVNYDFKCSIDFKLSIIKYKIDDRYGLYNIHTFFV